MNNNSIIKQMQKIELTILKKFLFVCEKLNLQYFIIGGTLLGAVRHKGFIPWDDDIDIGMPRKDYEIFLEKGQSFLPNNLFIQTYKTDPGYPHDFAKIRDSNTTCISSVIKSKTLNQGIFIDVFPLDVHSGSERCSFLEKIKGRLQHLRISYAYKNRTLSLKIRLCRWISLLVYPKFQTAMKALAQSHSRKKTGDKLANYSGVHGEKEYIPTEWYGKGKTFQFEDLVVIGPCEPDKFLTQIYGAYMIPHTVEEQNNHKKKYHEADIIDTEKSYLHYIKIK